MDTDERIRLALQERRPEIDQDDEDDAWAAVRRRADQDRRRRHHPLVAAVAAVAVVLVGAVVLIRSSGDGRVDDPAGPTDVAADPGPTIPPGDPGTWRALAPSPLSARYASSTAWTGREVLVLGGTDQECPDNARCADVPGGLTDSAAYDPATDTWRRLADAPLPFAGASAVWTGDVALVFVTGDDGETTLLAYDPDDDGWSSRAESPVGFGHEPVWTGQRAVMVAPRLATDPAERADQVDWAYDPDDDTWSALPADPADCAENRQGAWAGERLVVFSRPCLDPGSGGIEPGLYYRTTTFDPATDTWAGLPDSGVAGWGTWTAHGDKLVSLSIGAFGKAGTEGLAAPTEMGGILDLASGTWSPLPGPGPDVTSVRDDVGYRGSAGDWVVAGRRMFDPATNQWRVMPPPPPGSAAVSSGVWTGTEILLWGGAAEDGSYVATGAAFTPPAA